MVDQLQITGRGIVEQPDDGPPRIGFPARCSETPESVGESVPELGEHTTKYLDEARYDPADIVELRELSGVR